MVVIGAGFGGLAVLRELARVGLKATLVDRHQYTTFQPLLYQVATGGLNLEDVAFPVRTLLRRMRSARFVRGEVVEVNWECHAVGLEDGTMLDFDHLVLATGAATNFFGVAGAAQHALPLYTLTDAARFREHLVSQLEHAAAARTARPGLRAVVVGGGPTGVETAGALAELRDLLVGRDYPELDRPDITLELLERGPGCCLPPMPVSPGTLARSWSGVGSWCARTAGCRKFVMVRFWSPLGIHCPTTC